MNMRIYFCACSALILAIGLAPLSASAAKPEGSAAPSETTLPAANVRFAAAPEAAGDAAETPSFQRHVLPLFGRLGCNGRACHGSFQGQGGFRLSLFGYDFAADHGALVAGDSPRVDLKKPAESLMIAKPTLAIDHEGGKRFEPGSWQHHLLLRWIAGGAKPVAEGDAEFVALEVEPREILFSGEQAKAGATLRATAVWSDGTREDVTPLCRFRTNDESIAEIDETGLVRSVGPGDTHVVVFYDNGVAAVPVLRPVSDRVGPNYPPLSQVAGSQPTPIDRLVVAKLQKLGIVPSEVCTDAEFLRRLSLDMTGTLPAEAEVRAFLADTSADKRTRKIDELLERPAYAAWWTTRLCDLTGNNAQTGPQGGEQSLNDAKSRQWYGWIYARVSENVPYDKLVEGIALAVGRGPETSFDDYCREMSAYFRTGDPADFAARSTMPYFWTRRNVGSPDAKALSFSYAFLGVSLQCAQCHKHPFDQWTKQDFDQFTAFFNGVRYGLVDRERINAMKADLGLKGDEDSGDFKKAFKQAVEEGKTAPFKDVSIPRMSSAGKKQRASSAKLGRVITPRLLGGEEVLTFEYDDPRRPVMDWMRQADNPYFARAFVNRVWAGYFNVGIVEPTDDLNLANPPSNAELLDYLTERFVASGYDMKALHREIAGSLAYRRSRTANDTNRTDDRNFSRAVLRRLPAEAAYDAVRLATMADDERAAADADPRHTRAIGEASGLAGKAFDNYAVALFGKPPRAINCDCERSSEPSLLQTVYLRNDQDVWKRISPKSGWLKQVSADKNQDTERLIESAWLRTLGRPPSDDELKTARRTVAEAPSVVAGLQSLLWALLNTKEFIVNH